MTDGRCPWLAEIDHPPQRSMTVGKLTVKAPLALVTGWRTSFCVAVRVTRTT